MNSSGVGGGTIGATATGIMSMNRSWSPFTMSQWQELEHQALIFKYMMAGLPVPPDLVLPIQKSFDSISHKFFHHPTMGYCSIYGKKVDPEPGRCRRTDGKKWRCSKDAYPDSKYCERHMHRGRNRSRKPVESQTLPVTSSLTTAATNPSGGTGGFQNLPLNEAFSNSSQVTASGTSQSLYQLDSIPYGIPNKDYRYVQGLKPEIGEHSFFSEASGCNRGLSMEEAPMDNTWSMIPSRVSSYAASKSSMTQTDYPVHSFFNNEYELAEPVKEESHSLRPFLDEWPRTKDSWSGLDEERSNQASFSKTQLSISIPMASPDFFAPSSRSPHDN